MWFFSIFSNVPKIDFNLMVISLNFRGHFTWWKKWAKLSEYSILGHQIHFVENIHNKKSLDSWDGTSENKHSCRRKWDIYWSYYSKIKNCKILLNQILWLTIIALGKLRTKPWRLNYCENGVDWKWMNVLLIISF